MLPVFGVGIYERGLAVMHYFNALDWLNFQSLDVAGGFYPELLKRKIHPLVGLLGLNEYVFFQRHHDIRLPNVPTAVVIELLGRRHVRGISEWRSLIGPLHELRNLSVAE